MIRAIYHSPLGDIQLVADGRGLTGLWFADEPPCALPDGLAAVEPWQPFCRSAASADAPTCEDIAGMDAESGAVGMACTDQRNVAALGVIERAWAWLNSYFAGQAPLWIPPLHLDGSELEHAVYVATLTVPYGETITCAELAARVSACGSATGADEVAKVLAAALVCLIVPIHRISDATRVAHRSQLLAREHARLPDSAS